MLVVREATPLRSFLRVLFPCLATRRGDIQLLATDPTSYMVSLRGEAHTKHISQSGVQQTEACVIHGPALTGMQGDGDLLGRHWTELANVLNQGGGSHGHSLVVPHGIAPTVSHPLLVQSFLQGQHGCS